MKSFLKFTGVLFLSFILLGSVYLAFLTVRDLPRNTTETEFVEAAEKVFSIEAAEEYIYALFE